MKQPKFFIGPMTQNVIDSVIEVAEENDVNFGFIATRRQIDIVNSYVGYDTWEYATYVRNKSKNVLVCRDHAGAGQGNQDLLNLAYQDISSLHADVTANLDIIHIDPWKKFPRYEEGLRETINNILYVNSFNSNILFEVGTEEAIRPFSVDEFTNFLIDLKIQLGPIFKNIQYAVIQSGTRLMGTKNIGIFDLVKLRSMVKICKDFNILSKEHNGDYLSDENLKIRFDNGLDAVNIAPEFGVIETKVLLDNIKNDKDFEKIYDICLNGGKWKKWVPKEFHIEKDKTRLIEICGHYHNKEIKQIVNIDDNIIKDKLKEKLQKYLKLM